MDEEQRKIDNFETNAYSDILDNAIESQWPSIEGEMYQPFDTGIDAREAYINAQNEYVDPPPVFSGNIRQDPQETPEYLKWLMADPLKFPPRGPHDPFDPSQNVFEDEKEYRAWLRRKRLGY